MLHMLFEEYGVREFYPVPISSVSNVFDYPMLRGVDSLQWQHQIDVRTASYYGVIGGHYDWTLAERLPNWRVLVMLRHPVDQIVSLYQYMCSKPHEIGNDLVNWMKRIGFEAWVQSDHANPYLNNQTTYLSGHHCKELRVALRNLQSERVTFGLVEKYQESIDRFNTLFGWSLILRHENASTASLAISELTWSMVEKLQHDDMVLYETALELFGKGNL